MVVQRDGKIVVVGDVVATDGIASENVAAVRFTASGRLDPTFGKGGQVATGTGSVWLGNVNEANGVALDKIGRIVIVGGDRADDAHLGTAPDPDSQFIAARYMPSGRLDTKFGDVGRDGPDPLGLLNGGSAIALQPDGKAIVASDPYTLARFSAAGTLDPTFGFRGQVLPDRPLVNPSGIPDPVSTIVVQADGKTLVAGGTNAPDGNSEQNTLIRYNANGTRDASFGLDGLVSTTLNHDPGFLDAAYIAAVALQSDGKIVVADSTRTNVGFTLLRYNRNGSLDASFGKRGVVDLNPIGGSSNTPVSLVIRPDGHILVGGSASNDGTTSSPTLVIAALNPNGSADATFGVNGAVLTTLPDPQSLLSMRLLSSGTLVAVGGYGTAITVAHYDANGQLDSQFGTAGLVTTTPYPGGYLSGPTAIAADGSFYVVDSNNDALLNFSSSGLVNQTFGTVNVTSNNYLASLALAPDGSVYVAIDAHLITLARVKP